MNIKKLTIKYSNLPVTAKAALWFVICEVIQKCISMITVPIFTRIMAVEEYGVFNTFLATYSVLTVICTLNMERCIYINRLTNARTQEEIDNSAIPLLSLAFVFSVVVSIIVVIITLLMGGDLFGLPLPFVVIALLYILFDPAMRLWNTRQRYQFHYKKMVVVTISMVLCSTTLGLVAVIMFPDNQAFARAISLVVTSAIFGGIILISFIHRANCFFSTYDWRHVFSVQLPLLPHALSLTILVSSDRIMINMMSGSYDAAIYSVSYTAGFLISTIKNSIVSAIEPWMFKKIKDHDEKAIRNVTNPLLLFVLGLTIAFAAFAPEIVRILAPIEYYEAIYIIPPVALSSFFIFLYNIFSLVSFFYEDTKKIMYASVSSAVLNIFLNAIFIGVFGYIAAGYTTLVCYIFLAFAHYLIMKSVIRKNIGDWSPFDLRLIMACSIISIISVFVFAFIYNNIILRYSIIAIMGVATIVFRKRIFEILQTVKGI